MYINKSNQNLFEPPNTNLQPTSMNTLQALEPNCSGMVLSDAYLIPS